METTHEKENTSRVLFGDQIRQADAVGKIDRFGARLNDFIKMGDVFGKFFLHIAQK